MTLETEAKVDIIFIQFSISEGSVFFPDYLEVITAVVVPCAVGKTSPRTSI